MQSAIDAFEKANSVPQIQKDRLGRYQFMPVRMGLKDCCGFVYRIINWKVGKVNGQGEGYRRNRGRFVR